MTTLGSYSGTFEPGLRFTAPLPFQNVEYVDVAKAFYEDDASGLVNAALDAIARQAGTDMNDGSKSS